MKIRPAGDELFHADGRTDMTKLTIAFSNYANVPATLTLGFISASVYEGVLSSCYFGKTDWIKNEKVVESAAKNGVWTSPDNSIEAIAAEHCHW